MVTIFHGIIVAPLWSGYTDAYTKGDIHWIRKVILKLNVLMIPIIFIVSLLVIFSKDIISVWVGPNIQFSRLLVILMAAYVVLSIWSNIYAYFLNGIGKIKIQMYSSIVAGLINIPISIFFIYFFDMGTSGVILGTIVSLSLFAVIGPIQSYFVLKK
jgi:Na+-driven multidrug efflux pump